MRIEFETTEIYFTGTVVAGHLDGDSLTVQLDPEYNEDNLNRVRVNPDYCTVIDNQGEI